MSFEKVRSSFFEKKEPKKRLLLGAGGRGNLRVKRIKVFCGAFLQKSDRLLWRRIDHA
jgi:hypothetical protein